MLRWLPLAAVALAQVGYPVVSGPVRAAVVALIVALGYAFSAGHALATRGRRTAIALITVTTLGGLAVEAVGVATGFPFGRYEYGDALGSKILGVPLLIPLAWTWMAWPAWIAAGYLTRHRVARVTLAGSGLAAWDLFLDPQMVRDGYWRWLGDPSTLPGVPGVPLTNYLGWLVVATGMMALFAGLAGGRVNDVDRRTDDPMATFYVWTYFSSLLAHAAFLHLPGSALWGGVGMGLVALPLLARLHPEDPRSSGQRTPVPVNATKAPAPGGKGTLV